MRQKTKDSAFSNERKHLFEDQLRVSSQMALAIGSGQFVIGWASHSTNGMDGPFSKLL